MSQRLWGSPQPPDLAPAPLGLGGLLPEARCHTRRTPGSERKMTPNQMPRPIGAKSGRILSFPTQISTPASEVPQIPGLFGPISPGSPPPSLLGPIPTPAADRHLPLATRALPTNASPSSPSHPAWVGMV